MKEKKRKHIPKDDETSSSVRETEEIEVKHPVSDESSVPHINRQTNADDDEETTATATAVKKRKRKKKQKDSSKNTSASNQSPAVHPKLDTISDAEKLNHVDYTIYVEGIPFDCSEEEVQEFFTSHGCTDVLEVRLPKWQDSGRLRGYGHVVFQSMDSCQKAILELNRKTLKTRYLNIQPANTPKGCSSSSSSSSTTTTKSQPIGCKTIFVKNLPYDNCVETDLEKNFSVYGKIIPGGVRIVRNSITRQSKGFAYIEFKNPEGAYAAVSHAYNKGIRIQNRPCVVDYDDGGRVKESYRTAEGQLWKREYSNKTTRPFSRQNR